jgi:hypothetical protein
LEQPELGKVVGLCTSIYTAQSMLKGLRSIRKHQRVMRECSRMAGAIEGIVPGRHDMSVHLHHLCTMKSSDLLQDAASTVRGDTRHRRTSPAPVSQSLATALSKHAFGALRRWYDRCVSLWVVFNVLPPSHAWTTCPTSGPASVRHTAMSFVLRKNDAPSCYTAFKR